MKEIDRVGLLKMDFLGLSTLTLLEDAVNQIRATTGTTIELDRIPLDDEKSYQLFSEGQTLGVFQFESSGMRETLRKAKPQRFEDLIALNALYRPGPLRGGVVDDFINRRHGKVKITYEVPELEPILADSYGVIAYQEQVMRIASDLAGFTMGEADVLRKAMGKKDATVMEAQRARFVSGATERAIPKKTAAKIFDLMEHFAGYGFNKSHSTAYALLAYHTAYLKANYPWHFMAALLTIERHNTDKLALYLGECRDLNIPILAPDLNTSDLHFTVTDEGVRYGLARSRTWARARSPRSSSHGRRAVVCRHSTGCVRKSTCASSTSGCSRVSSRPVPSTRCCPMPPSIRSGKGEHSCSLRSIRRSSMVTVVNGIATRDRPNCSVSPMPRGRTGLSAFRMRERSPRANSWRSRRRPSGSISVGIPWIGSQMIFVPPA